MNYYLTLIVSFFCSYFSPGLNIEQLKQLARHQYSANGVSLIEPWFQPFWSWVVELLPRTWAPNAITITGLLINIVTSFIIFFYSPDGLAEVPSWAYILCAIGLFLYQTMDAIDGKQARRTKSSSPLGELFDHGCDAVSISFIIMTACIALQLGTEPPVMVFQCFAATFLFYTVHWQTYCTGKLKFGLLDVTEGQISVIFLYLITAFFGCQVWSHEIPILNIPIKRIPIWYSIFGAIISCHSNFKIILMQGGIGRNGSTVAGTSVLSPLIPIASLLLIGVMVWIKSTTMIFRTNVVLFLLLFGVAAAKITTKLVIAHMSCSEMERLDISLLGPGALFLNQYFDTFFNEYYLIWICFIFCSLEFILYFAQVCSQIAQHLHISVFHLNIRQNQQPYQTIQNNPTNSGKKKKVPTATLR